MFVIIRRRKYKELVERMDTLINLLEAQQTRVDSMWEMWEFYIDEAKKSFDQQIGGAIEDGVAEGMEKGLQVTREPAVLYVDLNKLEANKEENYGRVDK